MKIIFTFHAKERMSERKIEKEWVKNAIKDPDTMKEGRFNKKIAVKSINKQKISVVYSKEDDNFIVITAYWGE